MIPYSRRTLFRLKLSTALAGTLFAGRLCAELPGNYTIPIGNVPLTNPVVTATDNGAGLPVAINATDIPPADYENLAIQLRRGNTVLNWGTFNLTDSTDAQASTLAFTSTVGAASVLNRVSAGNPSTILGTITATPDVAVWLVNTSGITVGAGGSFNGAALVLSASDITPADFNNILLPNKPLTGVNTAAPISLTGAGALTATGSIIVVGQAITANKAMTSTNGEVALIAARDLTLPISLGSPLAITITKGTNLGTAVNIGAVLSGQSVRIVGAGEGGAIASLLNINAGGLLTATAANGVVVLATQSNVAAGVTISGAAAVDGITVGDALTASGAGGDVVLSATGALSSTGTIIANDIVDAKGATVNLANATATNGALKLSASTGDLTFPGGATYSWGTHLALSAAQDVLLGAALTSPGDVTINAGRDAIGDGITTTAGNIAVTAGRDVKGTSAGRMSLVAGGAGKNVTVTATAGTAFLGPMNAAGNVGVTANLIDATPITAGGSISLDQTSGNLTYPGGGGGGGIGNNLFLRAPGSISLIGNISVPGSVTIRAGVNATGNDLTSQTSFVDLLATTGLAQFGAVRAATNLTVKAELPRAATLFSMPAPARWSATRQRASRLRSARQPTLPAAS
jgi:filamentous hemagglutinin family protein